MAFPSALYPHLSGSLGALFLLRVIQGIGFSCAFGIIGAMVARGAGDTGRRRLLGMLTVVGISTHALGPALGEYLIAVPGFPTFFTSAAAFGLVACALGFLLPPHAPGGFQGLGRLDLSPRTAFSSVMLGVVFGAVVVFLPPYLLTRGVQNSSPFFIAFVLGSLATWTVLNRFVRSLGEIPLRLAASTLLAAILLFIHAAGEPASLVLLSIAFGIGYGYLYPALNAGLIQANPEAEGLANALFVWSFNLGMLVVSAGFGFLSEWTGYESAFRTVACLWFVCLATAALWRRKASAR
jgi:predicted MFS family arabinose efflux permease